MLPKQFRILVVTGDHSYKIEQFNQMLESLGPRIAFEVMELPGACAMFMPENRNRYDVLNSFSKPVPEYHHIVNLWIAALPVKESFFEPFPLILQR